MRLEILLHLLKKLVVGVLAFLGLIFIALVIYYYPVLDRIYNPCSYYPEALADCKEK